MEDQRQRFSLRKYGVGVASVLIGLTFMGGYTATAHADTQTAPVVAVQDSQNQISDETNSTADQPVADSVVSSQTTASQATSDSTVKSTSATSATSAESSAVASSADQTASVAVNQDAKSTSQSQASQASDQAQSAIAASVLTNLAAQPASENAQYNVNDWSYTTNADGSGITITGYTGNIPTNGAYYIPNSYDFRQAGKIHDGQQAMITVDTLHGLAANNHIKELYIDDNNVTKANVHTNGLLLKGRAEHGYTNSVSGLFQDNTDLTKVDFSGLDTTGIDTMANMFSGNTNLTEVTGLDNFDTSSVRGGFGHMFANDVNLTKVSGMDNWDVTHVDTTDNMFLNDSKLTDIGNLSNWSLDHVSYATHMFDGASALENIGDISNWGKNWDTTNIGTNRYRDLSYLFNDAKKLNGVGNLGEWKMSTVGNTSHMFSSDEALTSVGDLSNWNLKNNTDASYMFFDARSITSLGNLDGWFPQGSKVTTLQGMFDYTPKLEKLSDTEKGIGNWDVSNVTNMGQLFRENQNPDDSNPGNNGKLSDYGALKQIGDLSGWDVSKVTYLEGMFQGMSAASVGDLSGWRFDSLAGYNGNTHNYDGPVSIGYMFQGAHNLTDIGDISHWFDNRNEPVTNLNHAFDDSGLENINISGWKFADNADVSAMFTNLHNPATITANNLTNAPTFTANDFSRIKNYGGQGFQSTATDQPLIVISNSISTDLNNQTLGGGDFLDSGKGHPANTVTFVSTSDENTPVAHQQQNFVFTNTDALNTALGNISKDSNIDTVQYDNGTLKDKYVAATGAYLNGKHNATGTEYADNYGKIAGTYSIQTQQDVTDQQIAAHDPQLDPIKRQYLVVERFPKSYGNTHHDVLTAEQYRSQYPTATDVSDDYVYKVVLENNATIYKTATKNLLNNQITYSNNYSEQHIIYDNPIGNFTKPGDDKSYSANNPVDQPAGYTPSSQNWSSKKYNSRGSDMLIYNYNSNTKEYTYDFINSVPGSVVTDTFNADDVPANRQFYIDYTANQQTGKISYVDENGNPVGNTTLTGTTGEEVEINPVAPDGYQIVSGQDIPKTETATANGIPDVTVKVVPATITVTPDDPKNPSDKLPDGTKTAPTYPGNGTYPAGVSKDDLNKIVTRKITVTNPDGTSTVITQEVKFTRTATINLADGNVTYGDWVADGNDSFAGYTAPTIPGYTASGNAPQVDNVQVTDTFDDVHIVYIADQQNDGNQPGTAGNSTAGTTVNSSANIPAAAPKQGAQQLPQTGNDSRQVAAVAGLALASLAGIFGFGAKRKKEDQAN